MQVLFRAEVDLESFMAGGYIGSLLDVNGKRYAVGALTYNGSIEDLHGTYPVKKDTLSINLEDMVDSEGNKIFASLSIDGKGGDVCEFSHHKETAFYTNNRFFIGNGLEFFTVNSISKVLKVTGIQL